MLNSPLLISWLLSALPSLRTGAQQSAADLDLSRDSLIFFFQRSFSGWPSFCSQRALRSIHEFVEKDDRVTRYSLLHIGWQPLGTRQKKKSHSVCGFIGIRWLRVGNLTKQGENLSDISHLTGLLCRTDSVCGFIGMRWRQVGEKVKNSTIFRSFKPPNEPSPRSPACQSISECGAELCVRLINGEQTNTQTQLFYRIFIFIYIYI